MDIKQFLQTEKTKINERIYFHLDQAKRKFKKVSTINNDCFERVQLFATGGKGVRGGLFIATAELFGFTNKKLLLDIGATLEILHASLLIHDDIIDNDPTRRGNPSIYSQYIPVGKSIGSDNPENFGKAIGICIGDIGFFIALDIFRKTVTEINSKNHNALYELLFQELITVVLGQMDDITFSHAEKFPKTDDIISMYTFKTAHYTFSLPFILAAVLTNQSEQTKNTLEEIGVDIGILFQIKDDEIGLFSTEAAIGKPIGSDIRENKKTILRAFLETNMDNNDRKKLEIIIKKTKLSSDNIKTVLHLLKKYDIKNVTETFIKKYYSRATKAINTLNISKEHKNLLLNLTNYVVERAS